MRSGKSWVEISAGNLQNNFSELSAAIAPAGEDACVLAVVKADAYGHGVGVCSPVLARAGARWLGVSDAAEGAAARAAMDGAGIARAEQPDVLVMCGMSGADDAVEMIRNGLVPVVWAAHQVEWMAAAGVGGATAGLAAARVHVEIETGMARQGVRPGDELDGLLRCLREHAEVRVDGVMTHFASAEVAWSPLTAAQEGRFGQALEQVAAAGLRPEWVHAGNSSTLEEGGSLPWLRGWAERMGARAMVRTGLGLYGYLLPLEGAASSLPARLRPVMTWKTRVVDVRSVEAGTTVGYNASYTARGPKRLALLPVGYADGLRRELSSTDERVGGWVVVRGVRAPVVGRISMNLTVVDVTGIGEAAVGDEVELLGAGVTAEDHARLAGTIPYEALCGIRAEQRLVV